ncbi:hypothetical protein MPSEU_000152900 [Mayamaea pseudoterrestris]|nr:hypothetical protein MPSEU_000152900 [Mayamaea pseudoterrestris]
MSHSSSLRRVCPQATKGLRPVYHLTHYPIYKGMSNLNSSEAAKGTVSFALLSLQNAETSSAVIQSFQQNPDFIKLAQFEGALTESRDNEDDEKLQAGINIARAKGVIDANLVPAPYVAIDVLGKTPEQVANLILDHVQATNNENHHGSTASDGTSSGYVIVIVGRSGTGKGTTVAQLVDKLSHQRQSVVTWSNGNVFRALTLLATSYAEEQKIPLADVLTKEQLTVFMEQISITTKSNGEDTTPNTPFDILIRNVGRVSEIQNTLLKSPVVSQNIPTVAEATQGEVILICAKALQVLAAQGVVVLLEGRAPTVNYVPTMHRFELVLSDASLIGQRRAAQRVFGEAYQLLKTTTATTGDDAHGDGKVSDEQVKQAMEQVLSDMVNEIA